MEASAASVASEGPPEESVIPEVDPTPAVNVKCCGDIQLWVVHCATGQHAPWQLPVLATPLQDEAGRRYWRLEPTAEITATMHRVLLQRLDPYRLECVTQHWVLDDAALHEVASKAEGITPSYYVRWPTVVAPRSGAVDGETLVESKDPRLAEMERFLRYVVSETGIAPLPQLKTIWRAITQSALVWLSEKHAPLNLGFARVVPLPYRANWKEIFLAMHPGSSEILIQHKAKPLSMQAMLLETGALPDLVNSTLMAINSRAHYLYWNLEILPTKAWHEASESYEKKRLAACYPAQYTEYIRRCAVKRVSESLSALVAWVKATSLPCGALDSGRTYGSKVLRAWIPKGFVEPRPPKRPPVRAALPRGLSLKGPENQDYDGTALEVLPPVPHLPPQTPDLRPSPGLPVSGPTGDNDTDGLRLLDSSEGSQPGGEVLGP